jgi:hypothetical protein
MNHMFGIGSHVAQWSQAMCYAWERKLRLRSFKPLWLWMDQTHCNVTDAAQRSPWLCYLPRVEFLCGDADDQSTLDIIMNSNTTGTAMPDPLLERQHCAHNTQPGFIPTFRAASIEYMFRSVSPLVIQEAQRQVGIMFGPHGAPDNLITVHVRWGDKTAEMKLVAIQDYINATTYLIQQQQRQLELGSNDGDNTSTANILLAITEDPVAANAFCKAAPPHWKIY